MKSIIQNKKMIISCSEKEWNFIRQSQNEENQNEIGILIKGTMYYFVVGQNYQDGAGEYKVLSIDNDQIEVEYLSGTWAGQRKKWTAKSRAEIIHNQRKRENLIFDLPFNINDHRNIYFKLLGLIAKKGKISIQVGEGLEDKFKEEFQTFKDRQPLENDYYVSGKNKWGIQYRIFLPKLPEEILNQMEKNFKLDIRNTQSGHSINNSAFVKDLFKYGFNPNENNIHYQNIALSVYRLDGREALNAFLTGFGFENETLRNQEIEKIV